MSLSSVKRHLRKNIDSALRGLSRVSSWSFRISWEYGTLFADREVEDPNGTLQAFAVSGRLFNRKNDLRLTTEISTARTEGVFKIDLSLPFLFNVKLRLDLGGKAALKIRQLTGKGASKLYGVVVNLAGSFYYTGYDIDRPEMTGDSFGYFRWKNICGKPKHEVTVLQYLELDIKFPGSHSIGEQNCSFKYVRFQHKTKWGWFPISFAGDTFVELVTDQPPKICQDDSSMMNQPSSVYYRLYPTSTTVEEASTRYAEEIYRLRQERWVSKQPSAV